MQNFTLGKKGYTMLLFALVLLIGSSPSFGQTCPEPGDFPASQTFCYLQTINDLDTDGFPVFQTSDTEGDTQPIPGTELLTAGAVYFVNSSTGDCRSPISVTVNNAPRPSNRITNSVVSGFEFTTCTPASFNSTNLADLFVAQTNYRIEVYDSEESTTPLVGATLSTGDSYFVGQVPTVDAAAGSCPSFRVAVGFNPNQIIAPDAETTQTFCENATVADLVAQGTYDDTQAIRWYRSQTANSPLASNTQLINGQTYFAAQVVNARGSITPPCETSAGDRAPVLVELNDPIIINTPAPGIVCETDVDAMFPSEDAIRNFYLNLLEAGVPRNGTFSPNAGQIAQMYQNDADGLGDFTTTYTVGEGSCESSVELTISVVPTEDAEAGNIEDITLPCGSTDVVVLDDDLLSDNATTGGTFSGTGVNADGNFDPTTVSAGTYTITYSVDDSAICVTPGTSSSTTFDIIVGDGTGTPIDPIIGTVCEDDVQTLFPSNDEVRKYLRALLGSNAAGSFSPTVAQLVDMYQADADGLGDFTTVFTPTNGTCNSAVELTISVVPVEDANAGTIENITLPCGSTDIVVLDDSILSDEATTGGTFSGTGVNTDGNFDPAVGPGTYTITYSVDDSANCVTTGTNDDTQFDIIVGDGTGENGGSFTGVVCEDDVQTLFPSNDEVRKYLRALLGSNAAGSFSPTVAQLVDMYQADADGLGDFTTVFTPTNGTCNSAVELTISVVPVEDANAGTIENITLPCGSTDIVVLDDSILSDEATTGGTFSGTGVNADGNFDPAVGPGTYTITYSVDDSANCVTTGTNDDTTFTITIAEGTDLGAPIVLERCITEIEGFLTNPAAAIALYNDALAERGITDLSGTFSPSLQIVGGQILTFLQNPTDSATFVTAYSTTSACGDSSLPITLTINNTTTADAGSIDDAIACTAQADLSLFSLLNSTNPAGGTFTSENGTITNGILDVSTAGTYNITYTVSESDLESCLSGSDSTDFNVSVSEGSTIPSPEPAIVCESDVQTTFSSIDEIRKFYRTLLPTELQGTTGTFNPTPTQLAQMYQDDEDGIGSFSTIYVAGNGTCNQIELTVTIVSSQIAVTGTIEDTTVCTAQGTLDLFSLLSDTNISGGTFSNESGVIANGLLDISNSGDYSITYTITESDPSTCLTGTDSTDFTVSVSEGDANAGADNSIEVCQAQVDSFSSAEVRSFYLDLLEEGIDTNGTFNPTINQIIAQYQQNKIADFTTVYTVGNGACTDSATLTITVNESTVANAGEDVNLTFCSNEDSLNLADYLSENAIVTGAFEGFEDGIFNPANNIGTTTFSYTVDYSNDEDECTTGNDVATFTITVNEPQDANAGGNVSATYCVGQDENVDLISLLGDDALNTGTFSAPYQNGLFNLLDAEVGVYTITYTVDGAANCAIGTDTATITITINNGPDAPTAEANQAFCLIDNPTVGDITVTGDNVVFYTDAELTVVADVTTTLISGMSYYATSTTEDAACSSEAVEITVTITDPAAPALSLEGDEFCRSDNPTIQDLINNFTGSGVLIYTSSTGGTALTASTALQNGVTYYGASIDGTTGCESSERLAVVAKVEFCGIPEGFSPNGDGINDRFVIPDIAENFPNYSIEVFNRWGNVVFKGNASTGDWDGISNQSGTLGNDVLPVGVYFYILNYNDGQTSPVQGKLYLSI
ncbi:gliding motility-associated-like protein [Gillisia mitskevichiae]|uniref:Gliding motility-associated-like protein n=1 Tax=Gillisia mitskevichiae TaxID=270921 RepID=A0A495P4N7_9FLAO|nr:gliding motility-associated C-terminal domain-containing protein [Gillisia mitskevichiae]RKS44936.1 gliding motility-associated-like protein [Gillisia mitskevichiae]